MTGGVLLKRMRAGSFLLPTAPWTGFIPSTFWSTFPMRDYPNSPGVSSHSRTRWLDAAGGPICSGTLNNMFKKPGNC